MVNARAQGRETGPVRSRLFSRVQLLISVGVVASARFAWLYSHVETDLPPPALTLFLCELPFVFCELPLITSESSKPSVRSAGIVFGTALSFCPLLFLLEFDAVLGTLGSSGYAAQLASFLPVCFITTLCLLGVSRRCGKDDRTEFSAWAKWGILGFLLVSLLVLLASLLLASPWRRV